MAGRNEEFWIEMNRHITDISRMLTPTHSARTSSVASVNTSIHTKGLINLKFSFVHLFRIDALFAFTLIRVTTMEKEKCAATEDSKRKTNFFPSQN